MSRAISALEGILTDKVCDEWLAPLMGRPLGFRTDRDLKPANERYSIGEVRECAIVALLSGFEVYGNEWNIIGGNFYAAKNGLERKVRKWEGIKNFELIPGGIQAVGDKGALVGMTARWTTQDGEVQTLVCDIMPRTNADGSPLMLDGKQAVTDGRIPVRVNTGMGADGILGKAERKMYARVLKKWSGMDFPDSDGDAIDTVGVEVVGDAGTGKTKAAQAMEEMTAKHKERSSQQRTAAAGAPVPGTGQQAQMPLGGEKRERESGEEG